MDANVGDFRRAAQALEGADKEIKKAVRTGLRKAAKPLGEQMVTGLADTMPHRGGLSARVGQAKPSIRSTGSNGDMRVAITIRGNASAKSLRAMNDGNLRHPTFGRKKSAAGLSLWRKQTVPAGGATRAFEAGAPAVRVDVERELNAALQAIAKKGSA